MQTLARYAPDNARNRPVFETGRFLIRQLAGDDLVDNTTALRLQRLSLHVGLHGERANLIAGLACGEVHDER